MQAVGAGVEGEVIVPGVPCVDRGNWGRERDIARSSYRMWCFAKKVLARIAPN